MRNEFGRGMRVKVKKKLSVKLRRPIGVSKPKGKLYHIWKIPSFEKGRLQWLEYFINRNNVDISINKYEYGLAWEVLVSDEFNEILIREIPAKYYNKEVYLNGRN